MQVMVGGSFEQSDGRWRKFETVLDENDLARLGADHGFDPKAIKAHDAFYLLEVCANVWFLEAMTVRYSRAWATPDNLKKLKEFKETRDKALSELGVLV